MSVQINFIRLGIAGVLLIMAIVSTATTGKFTPEAQPIVSIILYCFFLVVLALSFDNESPK